MISEAREKYWNFKKYEDRPSLKERRPILYELEKQLGSSRGTTYMINILERKGSYCGDIATVNDLKEAVKTVKGMSQESIELVKMFINMHEAA